MNCVTAVPSGVVRVWSASVVATFWAVVVAVVATGTLPVGLGLAFWIELAIDPALGPTDSAISDNAPAGVPSAMGEFGMIGSPAANIMSGVLPEVNSEPPPEATPLDDPDELDTPGTLDALEAPEALEALVALDALDVDATDPLAGAAGSIVPAEVARTVVVFTSA
jgi:hypothetical protein